VRRRPTLGGLSPGARGALKFRRGAADETAMGRVFQRILPLIVLAALVGGCGSSSSADVGSDGAPNATQNARTLVQSMLLKDGDLAGFHLDTLVPETVKADLPTKSVPHYAEAKRLITDNWVASAHSIILRSDGKVPLISTSNVFRSDHATRQIWRFWGSVPHGVTVRSYPAPGAPAGARLQWATNDEHASFELSWVQGRVISAVLLGAHPHERFTKVQLRRITLLLVNAANAQSRKVGNLSSLL
jgi:hypothetical protein